MKERGFSLLELVVVIGILGILTAAAIPSLAWRGERLHLDYEAARLATEVRYYRELIGTIQPQHKEFPEVSKESTPTLGFDIHGYYLKTGNKISRSYKLPDDIRLFANRREVVFSSSGEANPMSFCLQQGNYKRYVIIDIAGRVRVSRVPPE